MAENERDVAGELAEATLNGSIDLANQALDKILEKEKQSFWQRLRNFFAPRERERTREEDYLSRQPEVIADFMKNFQAGNEWEQSVYERLRLEMQKAEPVPEVQQNYLAMIGSHDVLRHLYQENEYRFQDPVKVTILQNPNCPPDLVEKAMHEADPELRKWAFKRPDVSDSVCYAFAHRETSPEVQAVLKERLGDRHPEALRQRMGANPVLRPDGAPNIGRPAREAQNTYEDQRKKLQELKKHLPLDAQINAARQKSEAQLAGVGKVRTPIAPER